MGDKVLVVGATSKVGRELVSQLAAEGTAVKAATRRPGEYKAPDGVEVVGFDYNLTDSMGPALDSVDRVFMLSKWTEPHPEMSLNRFIEHARTAEVGHVVYLTSSGVDKHPTPAVALVEKRLASTGVGYTILHPNWLMQDFSAGFLLPRIRDLGVIYVPGGSAKVSWVDARDVATVARAALGDGAPSGQTYELTGGEALSFEEIAEIMEAATERHVTYRPAEEDAFAEDLGATWEPEQSAYLVGLFKYLRDGQVAAVDPTLGQLLGRPPTPFADFVNEHASLWR